MRESLWRLLSPIFPKPSPCSRSAEQRHWSSCSSSRFSCKKKSREAFQESCLPLLVLSNATLSLTTKKKKLSTTKKKKKKGIFSRRRRRPWRQGRRAHQRPRLRRAHRGHSVSRLWKGMEIIFLFSLFLFSFKKRESYESGDRRCFAAAASRLRPSLAAVDL